MRCARLFAAAAVLCAPAWLSGAVPSSDPLPDPRTFLEKVRANLRSDSLLLDQYTFTEHFTERRLDSRGAVKKIKNETYEVYPSLEPGQMYRRLVAKDGKPLSPAELADRDQKHEARAERKARRRASEDDAARQKREQRARLAEKRVVDELFRMDDIAIAGREDVGGRPAIVVTFAPKPGYRAETEDGKVIQKLAGRAWVDEQDKQVVRLETRLLDGLGVGPGGLARLQKGAKAYFQRRKINGEIWLPTEARFTGTARVLFLFGARLDIDSRYSDYRKFSVGTETTISSEKGAN